MIRKDALRVGIGFALPAPDDEPPAPDPVAAPIDPQTIAAAPPGYVRLGPPEEAEAPVVPFPREISVGSTGFDVQATKRALSRAGLMEWGAFTPYFGSCMLDAVKALQAEAGIPRTGFYGEVTHRALVASRRAGHPGQWAFDEDAIRLEQREVDFLLPPDVRVRSAICSAGFFWYEHRLEVGYAETRPMLLRRPPQVPGEWDCSAYVTSCYYAAGAPDPNGQDFDGEGYCFEPSTRVLTSDLRWVPVGQIKVGDELWGFDENLNQDQRCRGRARRYRRATVLASFPSMKDCVRVCLDTGEAFVCSTDHPWLAYPPYKKNLVWTAAGSLLSRPHLCRPFLPWEPDLSYESGWVAGMFDGEGNLRNSTARGGRSGAAEITQATGATADKLRVLVPQYVSVKSAIRLQPGKRRPHLVLTTNGGGTPEVARFLGTVRPERLIAGFTMEGATVMAHNAARVVAIEPVGRREVQSIQTSTGTYLAEGFAVHNTGTLVSRGLRVSLPGMQPGDLAFYGSYDGPPSSAFLPGDPTHVALYVGRAGDGTPMVLSNGEHPMQYLALEGLPLPLNQLRHYPVA